MRIARIDANNKVYGVVIAEPGFFADGVADSNYKVGDIINPNTGAVVTPAPEVIKRRTKFYSPAFLNALTADEFDAIDASANVNVKKLVRRLTLRSGVLIDVSSQEYIAAIGLLLNQGLLTQERHDQLLQGLS